MPNIETLVYILSGAFALITTLGGVIWKLLRDESKDHASQIKDKADAHRVHELEERWQMELTAVKESNQKMVDKLEARHDRDLREMADRLGEQIKTTETNILSQLKLMIEMVKGKE